MNLVWLVVGIGICGIVARRLTRRPGRGGSSDLGFVSHHWLAEHRASAIGDRRS
jgi:hypothetical protein